MKQEPKINIGPENTASIPTAALCELIEARCKAEMGIGVLKNALETANKQLDEAAKANATLAGQLETALRENETYKAFLASNQYFAAEFGKFRDLQKAVGLPGASTEDSGAAPDDGNGDVEPSKGE